MMKAADLIQARAGGTPSDELIDLCERRGKRVNVPSQFMNPRSADLFLAKVGEVKADKAVTDFINQLGIDDTPKYDVVDPTTGEVLLLAGETKRKKFKDEWKRSDRFKRSETPWLIDFPRDEGKFERFYNIVWKSLEDMVDDPEMFYAGDYDVSYDIPRIIKRKDRNPFNEDDVENIEKYVDYYQRKVLPRNIELMLHYEGSGYGKYATTDPMFV